MPVPKLRFKDFCNEWKLVKLEKLLKFKNGINAPKESYGYGIKYISVGDILNNQYITYDRIKGLIDINEKTLEDNSVHYGDILFQRSSETIEDIGQANVYLDRENVATFGGFVIRGRKIADYDPLFFNYLLKTPLSRKNIIIRGAGAQHYNISQEELQKTELYFTDIKEQEKIAKFLSLLYRKIELQQRKIEVLKMYKKGLTKKILIYNNYEKIKLKDICKFYSGGTPNSKNKDFYNGDIPFIRSGEIHSDKTELFINEQALNNSSAKMVYKGSVLYALYGATSGEVSISKINGAINQAILCINGNSDKICNSFLAIYLEYYKNKIINTYLQGGQGNLSAEIIKKLYINLPSLSHQATIVQYINSISKKIDIEIKKANYLLLLKKSLLSKMFI